jgi:hypothetical protein
VTHPFEVAVIFLSGLVGAILVLILQACLRARGRNYEARVRSAAMIIDMERAVRRRDDLAASYQRSEPIGKL